MGKDSASYQLAVRGAINKDNASYLLAVLRRLVKAVDDASAARGHMTGAEGRAMEQAKTVLKTAAFLTKAARGR